jgi:hypothetical protein
MRTHGWAVINDGDLVIETVAATRLDALRRFLFLDFGGLTPKDKVEEAWREVLEPFPGVADEHGKWIAEPDPAAKAAVIEVVIATS